MSRVAVIQMQSVPGERAENLARAAAGLAEAARQGATVAVLPELCSSGYDLSAPQAAALAEGLDGPTVAAWTAAARQHGLYVAGGLAEQAGGRLYNSAVLVGPDGVAGVYRKAHLFAGELDLFAPGDTGFPVFDTPAGRIGLLICYDLRFPEAVRLVARAGADLICVPTAWVVLSGPEIDDRGYCMQAYCAMAHASMNQVAVACADAVGPWRGGRFLGGSLIAGPQGWPLAGPAPAAEPAVLSAPLDLAAMRASRQRNPRNHTWDDRRLDLYSLGTEAARTADWDGVAPKHPHPGITTRRLDFAHMTVVRYEFAPGAVFPLHHHAEEQLVVVVAGEVEFTVGGELVRVRAGDTLLTPSWVAHGGRAGAGGTVFFNVLAPRRTGDAVHYLQSP